MNRTLLLNTERLSDVKKIEKELLTIKPLKKKLQRLGLEVAPDVFEDVPIEILEKFLHELQRRYGYKMQWITPVYVDGGFLHYTASILDGQAKYIDSVTDVTMWGLVSKSIIVIWEQIKGERNKTE